MKKPTSLEDVNPALAPAQADTNTASARITELRADTAIRVARVQAGRPEGGNQEENKRRHILGQTRLPEVLPDEEQINKNREQLTILIAAMPSLAGIVQREKDRASAQLCTQVAGEHTALVKDIASRLSALHASHVRYVEFLDSLENVGASTTSLRPIWPTAIGHPRDSSGMYHWTFKEARENGHIGMKEIPEAVR